MAMDLPSDSVPAQRFRGVRLDSATRQAWPPSLIELQRWLCIVRAEYMWVAVGISETANQSQTPMETALTGGSKGVGYTQFDISDPRLFRIYPLPWLALVDSASSTPSLGIVGVCSIPAQPRPPWFMPRILFGRLDAPSRSGLSLTGRQVYANSLRKRGQLVECFPVTYHGPSASCREPASVTGSGRERPPWHVCF